MNFLIRLMPLFVGLGVSYAIASSVASSSKPIKFIAVSLGMLCMGYAFTWFNIFMARRSGDLLTPRKAVDKAAGHFLMIAGAVAAGYGFSVNNKIALFAALACLWFADDKLTPLAKRIAPPATNRSRSGTPGELTPDEQRHLEAVNLKRKEMPAAGVVYGGKIILERLMEMMNGKKEVHIESLLCALGALAGYACQASLREQARDQGLAETAALMVVKTVDGESYYFGDPLNQLLAESKMSVWNLAATAAREAGCKDLPDMNELFSHVTSTVGHATFGIPRVPAEHSPRASPIDMLRTYWPVLAPVARKFCATPAELPVLFALSIQEAIPLGKTLMTPGTAFLVAMEAAVPMSKVDFKGATNAA